MDDEKKTLKYFSDNKNFAKSSQKNQKSAQRSLEIIDDRIVLKVVPPVKTEDEIVTSYTYMKKKGTKKRWSRQETELFYEAVVCCGLDFSMMEPLFPDRARTNLKDKYKKELRSNQKRMENAIDSYKGLNMQKFEELKVQLANLRKK